MPTRLALIAMLSLPPDWDFSIRGMADRLNVSKDTMSKIVSELQAAGYLKRKPQPHGESGKFAKAGYILTDIAFDFGEEDAAPCPDLPYTAAPYTENSPQQNTKQENNKQDITPYLREVAEAVAELRVADNAGKAKKAVVEALEQRGFECRSEVRVPARSPDPRYTGRIGILAEQAGQTIAMELCRTSIREKSLYKLRHCECDARVVLLRGSDVDEIPDGIDLVLPLQVDSSANIPDWKPDRFARFWSAYPRGEAKQSAIRAWDRLKPTDELIREMAQTLKRQLASPEWQAGFGIPYASTWLNGRRWEDEDRKAPGAPDEESGGWDDDPEVY